MIPIAYIYILLSGLILFIIFVIFPLVYIMLRGRNLDSVELPLINQL